MILAIRRTLFVVVLGWFFLVLGLLFLLLPILGMPVWLILGSWDDAVECAKDTVTLPWFMASECWPRAS